MLRDGLPVPLVAYHGGSRGNKTDLLVFHEFGADFVDRCRDAGFEVELMRGADNPALVTFVARKPP